MRINARDEGEKKKRTKKKMSLFFLFFVFPCLGYFFQYNNIFNSLLEGEKEQI